MEKHPLSKKENQEEIHDLPEIEENSQDLLEVSSKLATTALDNVDAWKIQAVDDSNNPPSDSPENTSEDSHSSSDSSNNSPENRSGDSSDDPPKGPLKESDFTLEELQFRLSGELILGAEAEKIKDLLEKDGAGRFITNDQAERVLVNSKLIDQYKAVSDADLCIDEVDIDDKKLFIIEDFFRLRYYMEQAKKKAEAGQQISIADPASKDKLKQLHRLMKIKVIEFNRDIQLLLSRPEELGTLGEVMKTLQEATKLIHVPDVKDERGEIIFNSDSNRAFYQKAIEKALVGAIHEQCFKQLFELTDLGVAIAHYDSSVEDDGRGIDCRLSVKYNINQYNQYYLATAKEIELGNYCEITLPVDVKAKRKKAEEKNSNNKKHSKENQRPLTNWAVFSGVYTEDLSLARDKRGRIDTGILEDSRVCLDKQLIQMMYQLPRDVFYGKGNGFVPKSFDRRLEELKADILEGVKQFHLQQTKQIKNDRQAS